MGVGQKNLSVSWHVLVHRMLALEHPFSGQGSSVAVLCSTWGWVFCARVRCSTFPTTMFVGGGVVGVGRGFLVAGATLSKRLCFGIVWRSDSD